MFQMAFYTYIVTNRHHTVLYTGSTDDIDRRAFEHRDHLIKGFTHSYNCEFLIWFEAHDTREAAQNRERSIKRWRRTWKVELIEAANPEWQDLSSTVLSEFR